MGLDHVYKKLLVATSRTIATRRVAFIHAFTDQLTSEIAAGAR